MPWCYNPFFGSSPRVRGKQIARLRFHEQGRIIPARAGQTRACRRCHPPFPDHPRACGANGAQQGKQVGSAGSSPRVRGKRPCVGIGRRPRRIIPARAGQTMIVRIGLMTVSDHPRACGANMGMTEKLKDKYGSSPRVRGKLWFAIWLVLQIRIIPARAGQTVRFYAKTLERWTLNNWIRTVAPIFVLLFLLPVIGQNAYIERHYSNQSFSWFSKLHYASAFDLSLVA